MALVAPVLAGCSLIYNPNNLPDPRVIDAVVVDANPCAMEVTGISPAVIDEGAGDHGSAPALLVVHGNNLVNNHLEVELRPPDGATVQLDPIGDAVASHDTTYVAFTVTARVDRALANDVPLDVVVTQDAPSPGSSCAHQATLHGQLTLHGLRELSSTSELAAPDARYSMIELPAVALTGQTGIVLHAVSSITMGAIDVDAKDTLAGAGGYDGGGGGGGGVGGGGAGGSVTGLGLGGGGGGGGGGYAADGQPGGKGGGANGGVAGTAGLQCGDDELIASTNRASSGGAGGAGGLTAIVPGGAGGGGGGTVVLTAGGDISVNGISARGGNGTTPSGGGGGGGGGAGGTVLLRTANGTLSAGTIRVAGGMAGMPNGGAGSVGRVRWDAPGDTAPDSPDAAPVRGPSFHVTTRVFSVESPQIDVKGPRSRGFIVRVIDNDNMPHDGGLESFNNAGATTIHPQLYPGHDQVCVILDGGAPTTVPDQCIDVAYLP